MRTRSTLVAVLCLGAALTPAPASARICNEEQFIEQRFDYTTEEFTGELSFDPKCLQRGVKLVYNYSYGRTSQLDREDGGGDGACTRKSRRCKVSFALTHLPVEQSRYYFTITVDLTYRGSVSVSADGHAEWTCTSAGAAAFCE